MSNFYSIRSTKIGNSAGFRLPADTPQMKVIAILWLGFPRKEGAKDDCYEVFTKMVARGTFPDSLDELIVE